MYVGYITFTFMLSTGYQNLWGRWRWQFKAYILCRLL